MPFNTGRMQDKSVQIMPNAFTHIINGYVVGTNVFSVSDKATMTELHSQHTLRC